MSRSLRSVSVFLGLGSNLGDRAHHIFGALSKLSRIGKVVDTSFLYETAPLYITDQPLFLNAACHFETALEAHVLLAQIKQIEVELGRTPTVPNGPRVVDIDILLYGDHRINTESLMIPHPRIHEREFVLRPMCDMQPHLCLPLDVARPLATVEDFLLGCSVKNLSCSKSLSKSSDLISSTGVYRVLPLGLSAVCLKSDTIEPCHYLPSNIGIMENCPSKRSLWRLGAQTRVMSILNITPDSFSDGGKNMSVCDAVKSAKNAIVAGASILDIGGESTRPGSSTKTMSEAEATSRELNRVSPVIKAIREFSDIPLSVDTYRAEVAEVAINCGASLINDISGGRADSRMLPLAARLGVPICLMHMRGTPHTMHSLHHSSGEAYGSDVVETVRAELRIQIQKAIDAGVPRWNILVDPGIGIKRFSKTPAQNMQLLQRLSTLSAPDKWPLLVGASRKGFIGKILENRVPEARVWGTAAVTTHCASQHVEVVRVHDTPEMMDVCRVADAIYR